MSHKMDDDYDCFQSRVELLVPKSKHEHLMAKAMEAFSIFVLEDERESCLRILQLDKYCDEVGELQGGNDDYSIYRVVITNNSNNNSGAVSELLNLFHKQSNNNYLILTTESLQEYLLGMSRDRFDIEFDSLTNVMLVLSFGPTIGQVRHIDHTYPNAMICLYMSSDCPTTIVYNLPEYSSLQNSTISCCEDLIYFWEEEDILFETDQSRKRLRQQQMVPDLIKDILLEQEHQDLSESYFSFWKTLHMQLENFGKLYLPLEVDTKLSDPASEPGTTLIASGKAVVHSGPPTTGPRMFAYAIGVHNTDDENDNVVVGDRNKNDKEDENMNDGEVQYSPVLLHLDLCCLVFDWMKNQPDNASRRQQTQHLESKQFMIRILVDMIVDMQQKHGNETYDRLLSCDRNQTKEWVKRIVQVGATSVDKRNAYDSYEALIEEGICRCDQLFARPEAADSGAASTQMIKQRRKQRGGRKKKIRKGQT